MYLRQQGFPVRTLGLRGRHMQRKRWICGTFRLLLKLFIGSKVIAAFAMLLGVRRLAFYDLGLA